MENAVGGKQPRPEVVRARVRSLIRAAGQVHHVMACYGQDDPANDTIVSVLAELGVPSWLVPSGPDAAESALLAHARYAHNRGCRTFSVASADHQFEALAELGEVDVIAWKDQPVSGRLCKIARQVRRVPRPSVPAGTCASDMAAASSLPEPVLTAQTHPSSPPRTPSAPSRHAQRLGRKAVAPLLTGMGIAVGHLLAARLLDLLSVPSRRRVR